METKYYDGTKLLSLKDINGETPEIFLCTSNRSAGKTTYFARLLIRRFLNYGKKFALIYRFNYELDECADKFFKDINQLFFPDSSMVSVRKASGIFHELILDNKSCGYAISLNSSDQLKKYSHLFSDVDSMMMDEFQSETNHYCAEEVKKLISIHTTIARGQGKQIRYVPVYMISNPVSLINPYYVEMGISTRLTKDTHFLRGNGFVLEQGFNETASIAQKTSGFNRAFSNNSYVAYASENVYLNDNLSFIEKPKGNSRYLATIKFRGTLYAVREYSELGIIYCDDKPDTQFPFKIAITTEDHNINYVMIRNNHIFIDTLRFFFQKGCCRFKDLRCKEAILFSISY